MYRKVNQEHINYFNSILTKQQVLVAEEDKLDYSHDETEDYIFIPDVVLIPNDVQEVAAIMKYCNEHQIPVTPRAGGTGLSGGALAVHGGVILSMERFNKIIEVDVRNLQSTVEPGVITQVFMDEIAKHDLMYPVDPSSKGSCMLGGNLAESSGGPRAVKYGTVRDYVLNIEMVLASGEIIWTGANTLKYASGYNLTQLMIGSEGTLGVITKIVFKLVPSPKHNLLLLASFYESENACNAVSAIFRAGISPSALEFMEKDGVDWVVKYEGLNFNQKENIKAYLLIEVDGNDLDLMYKECEAITEVLYAHQVEEVLFADSSAQKEEWWKMRRNMAHSVKAHSIYKEEDTVVPRAELAKLLSGIKEIGAKYGFQSVCYGHAGDGNLHINIIKGEMSDDDWNHKLKEGIKEIFQLTTYLNGTISGEHGIGYVQKEYMHIKYSEVNLNLMRGIKKVFDPKGILNPGKIF
jgi:glycolate oxidase